MQSEDLRWWRVTFRWPASIAVNQHPALSRRQRVRPTLARPRLPPGLPQGLADEFRAICAPALQVAHWPVFRLPTQFSDARPRPDRPRLALESGKQHALAHPFFPRLAPHGPALP